MSKSKCFMELDNEGFLMSFYDSEINEVPETAMAIDVVTRNEYYECNFYRPKWNGTEWTEDMTQEEMDVLNNRPTLPSQEERIDMLENMILIMMEG